jgi:hypothetical protein
VCGTIGRTQHNKTGAHMNMYGSETWALNGSERSKIEIDERSLRLISGYTFTDGVRNATILNALRIFTFQGRNYRGGDRRKLYEMEQANNTYFEVDHDNDDDLLVIII